MEGLRLIWVVEKRARAESPLTYFDAVAAKIEQQPGLLEIPLRNIERWLARKHSAPHRLEQWRSLILKAQADDEGKRELLALLRDPGEEARHLRSFAPFAGVLTTMERRRIIRQCAFNQ